jgi:hypothetical protein
VAIDTSIDSAHAAATTKEVLLKTILGMICNYNKAAEIRYTPDEDNQKREVDI